jgi:hypothetical protein
MSAVIIASAIAAGLGVVSWIGAAVIAQALNNTLE